MAVIEMSRVDRITQTYDLAALFPNLTGFTAAGIALLPPRTQPNGSVTFQPLTITGGKVTVTYAGPDADSTGAFVVTGNGDVCIKVTATDGEVDTAKAAAVRLSGGGTITPLPAPGVATINGKTGAVVLSAADVGADTAGAATAAQAAAVAAIPSMGTIAADPALRAAFGALPKVAATVTTAGSLVVNKHNPVDATSGARTMTLPTGQPEGTQVSVEKTDASTNVVSVTGSVRGVGSSTLTLPWTNEALLLRADASGSWWPVAGHKTKASLDAAYGLLGTATHPTRIADIRRSKGGVVGTNGKPVVSFRIDHGIDQFLATFWPLFKARGIPCSVGVVTGVVGNPADAYEPTTTTYPQILAEQLKGFEVWAHSKTHLDLPTTGNSFTDEVVTPRATLEANGFRVIGWQQPGIPGATTNYSNNWNGDWSSEYGQRALATYGLAEMSGNVGGAARTLPTNGDYDLGHYTLDSMNYSTAKGILDTSLLYGLSTQWMMHPRFISGGTVTATVTDVTNFLDYVKTLWDSGTIEILTASGLAFADPGTARRLDLVRDGSFEAAPATLPSGSGNPWGFAGGAGTGITVPTDGGHTGSKYVHIPASASFSYVYQGNTQLQNLNAQGHTFIAEAWARCTVANTEARITVLDGNDATKLNYESYQMLTAGAGWVHMRVPFSIPMATTNLQIKLSRRNGTGDLDFDDVSIKAV